ncbi:hypothetical protein QEN19_001905 [Hanseniaspora menglaensis]
MINNSVQNFDLPEGVELLNTQQLEKLIKNEDYLTHHVINKSYNELKEIETIDKEIDDLKDIQHRFNDLISVKINNNIEILDHTLERLKVQLLDLDGYKTSLNTNFNSDSIKEILNKYLEKVKTIEIDPLKTKIEADPFDKNLHLEFLEKSTKWKKMKILFDSLK